LTCCLAISFLFTLVKAWLPKTDFELRELFKAHFSEFKELKDMMLAESCIWRLNKGRYLCYTESNGDTNEIVPDSTYEKKLASLKINPARINRYIELMQHVDASVVQKSFSHQVTFVISTDFSKFICYSGEEVPVYTCVQKDMKHSNYQLVDNTDCPAHVPDENDFHVASPIGSGWYILRDHHHYDDD